MKHLHRILLVLLFALCCSQAIWASVQPAGGKMVVNVKTLNMRKSPNVESPIETKLHRGDVVEVISGVQEGWVQVQIDGGYIRDRRVSCSECTYQDENVVVEDGGHQYKEVLPRV